MKKLVTCFFLIMFFTPIAHGANGAVSRAIPGANTTTANAGNMNEGAGTESDNVGLRANDTNKNSARVARRTNVVREVNPVPDTTRTPTVVRSGTRTVTVGGDTSSNTATRSNSAVVRGNGASRAAGANANPQNSPRNAVVEAATTVGRNARVSAASINNNPALRRAGVTLRPSVAEVGGRATIAGTDVQTGSNIETGHARSVTSRAATTAASTETPAEAKTRLEQTAELNKSCQEQYNDCMDLFCATVDTNQKRCACSANLTHYAKVEAAVKNANTELNNVAQTIRYVGLSADEISAILSETEAEQALSGKKDTSETRNMLTQIENMIKNPSVGTSSSSGSSFGLDMDLDFSGDMADMFNLDFLNMGSGNSMANLRGAQLYNAAKKQCSNVLNQCKEAGATANQISSNYELAIDKDCIAYEKGLTKMNDTLVSNVRSANLMLQKARLKVLEDKNEYDAKECVAALDTCMTNDMVCGENYVKCLDPTKRYIDENGNVVLGQDINKIIQFMENYNNADISPTTLGAAYNMTISYEICANEANNGACVMKYLLQKIGTRQKVTDEGLCRAVLDKCQAYTYDQGGKYKPYNDVVVNYVQRAMVNIKAAQHRIISDYASSCMTDIASCYNQQVTQINSWSSAASSDSVYKVMRGACRNVALTCAYAVFAEDEKSCPTENAGTCIDSISDMFYQSLLCPDNSTYVMPCKDGETDTAEKARCTYSSETWVNTRCKCNGNDGVSTIKYEPFNGQCLVECGDLETRNSYGQCVCITGASKKDGKCECNTEKYKLSDDSKSCVLKS